MFSNRFPRLLSWGLTLALGVGLLLHPSVTAGAAKNGLMLCGNLIVPTLFPFFILSSLLVSSGGAAGFGRLLSGVMGHLFHQPGISASALVLGFLGGYPVGAKAVCTLYEERLCDQNQAEHLLMFCNNPGPAFVLGAAGSAVFHSVPAGFLLLGIQICSALIVGILFRPKVHPAKSSQTERPPAQRAFSRCLTEAVQQAASATINVCAYVIFFNVVLQLLNRFGLLGLCEALLSLVHCPASWQAALVSGVLELSNGISALPGSADGLIPAALLLSWGGCSVHFQTLSLLGPSGLRLSPYFMGKLLQSAVSAALACLALRFFPAALPTMGALAQETPLKSWYYFSSLSVAVLLVGGIFFLHLYFTLKNTGNKQKKRV